MQKRLTKHGNSYAILIDKAILELLEITAETQLKISTDGKRLIITPVKSDMQKCDKELRCPQTQK